MLNVGEQLLIYHNNLPILTRNCLNWSVEDRYDMMHCTSGQPGENFLVCRSDSADFNILVIVKYACLN